MSKNFLAIGEFAEISRCSPRSLRYYEKIGALSPAHVDADTGYRYYNPQQAYQARLIKLGIDCGMSPKDLGSYLYDTDVYEMETVLETFEGLAEENYRKALVEKARVQAQKTEFIRQNKVNPLQPRWVRSGHLTQLRYYCADTFAEISYELYMERLRACLVAANRLDIANLAQEGLTQDENDDRWYIYLDVYDEAGLEEKIAENPEMRLHRYDRDEFVTQAVQGSNLENCFENVRTLFNLEDIMALTELWAFTMLTGIAAFEVTFRKGSEAFEKALPFL